MAEATRPVWELPSQKVIAAYCEYHSAKKIMFHKESMECVNSVNGDVHINSAITSLGRGSHVQQVAPDRHQTTALYKTERKTSTKWNIATWNVRTMMQRGKLENVKMEMKRMGINILGLSEVRWKGAGSVYSEGYRILYSGGEHHERGVGMVLDSTTAKMVKGYSTISDRVLVVKLRGKPFDLGIVQVYAPTTTHCDNEIEEFYEDIERALKQLGSQDIKIVMGDLNAKVGGSQIDSIVGPHGLGCINERGERLVEWCREHDYIISNTWFENHPRRKWTWSSPGNRVRNQIDYIMIQRRFRNSIRSAKSMPGADCNSDHVPVLCSIRTKLKRINRKRMHPKFHVEFLSTNDIMRHNFTISVQNKFNALSKSTTAEEKFVQLKESISEALQEHVPIQTSKQHKKWMNQQILDLMEERRKAKSDIAKYKQLNKEVKKQCNEARDAWLNDQCAAVELADLTKNTKTMHKKINEISGKRKCSQAGCIKAKDGTILLDRENILQRWSEYIEDLFHDERGVRPQINKPMEGPPILEHEVEYAIKRMKKGKAVGPDGISIELIEALGEWGITTTTELLNEIYDSGEIPHDMSKSIFIMLPKKPGANECGLHRTISLMSHLTKLLLQVLMHRMRTKIRPEISSSQFGFVADSGTRNAIFTLSTLVERYLEMQKDVYICFIDYSKAFDKVRHQNIMDILNDLNVDGKDLRLIRNLYWDQTAATRIDGEISTFKPIQRGVRQGCVLSPDLFNIYSEVILRDIECMDGAKVGGHIVNNLRYADDTALLAESEGQLQDLIDKVAESSEASGLELNVKKTECMVVSKKCDTQTCKLTYKNEEIKQVTNFTYLGYNLTSDGKCTQEIKRRIGQAKNTYNQLKHIMNNRNVNINTKIRIIRTYVWSVLLYGCECWKINKECERRIAACETWFYRRLLRISWKDKIRNEDVYAQVGTKPSLLGTILKRQLRFLGHVYRKDGIEKSVLTGKVDGKRGRGRQRTTYVENVRKRAREEQCTNVEFLRRTEDRDSWRSMITDVCNRRGT